MDNPYVAKIKGIITRIQQTPSFIKSLEYKDLEDVYLHIKAERLIHTLTTSTLSQAEYKELVGFLLPRDLESLEAHVKAHQVVHPGDLESLEAIVKTEQERRKDVKKLLFLYEQVIANAEILKGMTSEDLSETRNDIEHLLRMDGLFIISLNHGWYLPEIEEKLKTLLGEIRAVLLKREIADEYLQHKNQRNNIGEKKPTQVQLALYYKFLQGEGLYPNFSTENIKTKTEMCIEIGERHEVSADKFEQTYNKTKITDATVKNLIVVVALLEKPEHIKAKNAAMTALKIAETKSGKR